MWLLRSEKQASFRPSRSSFVSKRKLELEVANWVTVLNGQQIFERAVWYSGIDVRTAKGVLNRFTNEADAAIAKREHRTAGMMTGETTTNRLESRAGGDYFVVDRNQSATQDVGKVIHVCRRWSH